MPGCDKMDRNQPDNSRDNDMPDASPREVGTGPRNQRKRPGDLTGTQGQRLAAERDARQVEEAEARAAEKVQERTTALNTVVDYTHGGVQTLQRVDEVDVPDEPLPETMTIRVNYPIEDMTFGREVVRPPVFGEHGEVLQPAVLGGLNTYNFEEGKQYVVPRELGGHLKSLGYVYDF